MMERALGRPLLAEESVHHKNGVRSDNRLDNLEIRVSHPQGQTLKELAQWYRRYCDETNTDPLTGEGKPSRKLT